MNPKVLVVAAHPDDEVLGCGGTMAKHVQQNHEVHVVILAEGITSREKERNREAKTEELSALDKSAHRVKEILGASSISLHGFPDNRMDSVPLLDVVKCIEEHITSTTPHIVYTHHGGDVNIDHQITHHAVVTACRPQPGNSIKRLLFFEVPSSTEWHPPSSSPPFIPNWYEDISNAGKDHGSFLDLKQKALEAYATEMRPWPHARSFEAVEHLARWRGANVGVKAAEAFVLGREIS